MKHKKIKCFVSVSCVVCCLIAGLILNGGNGGNCLRCPWSLPWCPFISPNRNLQIPHRGALCQGKIALPLQVRSIRPLIVSTGMRFNAHWSNSGDCQTIAGALMTGGGDICKNICKKILDNFGFESA